jgi:hypothetical protein
MRSRHWLALGAVLAALGGFAVSRVGPAGEDQALSETPLLRLPLSSIGVDGATLLLRIPDSLQWNRIRSKWGDPGVMIFAARTGSSVIEFASLGVDVQVSGPDGRLPISVASGAPFGRDFLSAGSQYGVRFRGKPGEDLQVRLSAAHPEALATGELIAKYEWGHVSGKDHAIAPPVERLLEAVGKALVVAGVAVFAFGLGLWRQGRIELGNVTPGSKKADEPPNPPLQPTSGAAGTT